MRNVRTVNAQRARRLLDRGGEAERERALDVGEIGDEVAPHEMDGVPSAQEHAESDEGGEALGGDRRQRRALDAEGGDRAPAEDQRRIEDEVEDHRAEDDEHRQLHLADPAHDRLKHEEKEVEYESAERDAHEPERAGIDVGGDAHEAKQSRRDGEPQPAQDDRDEHDHEQGLRGDVVDHLLVAGAEVLRNERRSGQRQPRAEPDRQKHHRSRHRYGRDGAAAQPPDPVGVDQLVRRLEDVGERDRDGQRQQRPENRAFEQSLMRLGHGLNSGHDSDKNHRETCSFRTLQSSGRSSPW
jgi:hypothetical protein